MPVEVVGRTAELAAVAALYAAVHTWPAGLLLEGEAGIGKTTVWLAALQDARGNGFHVLSARAWEAESILAYGAVADLLTGVDAALLSGLPEVQRVAVNRVMLRGSGDGPETDQHVVAAALLRVIDQLSADAPVVVGIDDLQWLDSSSRAVIAFVARRLNGRVGLIATERTSSDSASVRSWLQLPGPDALTKVQLRPLSLGGLHQLVSSHLGRSLPRPTMVRVADVSGGNPFYALEMARGLDSGTDLPSTLADVVQLRLAELDADTHDALLAAASTADPTVDMLARATGTSTDQMLARFEEAESRGIIEIVGEHVRYTHPLLARGVYVDAKPARRRRIHRALADVVEHPELKARHLALAASRHDPEILAALDAAAHAARARGALVTAAEFLDLAIKLGGDTPVRRLRSADNHFRAGDADQAHAVLAPAIDNLRPGMVRALALSLLAGIWIYRRSFHAAAEVLEKAVRDAEGVPAVLAQTLLLLSFAQANSGNYAEALRNAEKAVAHAEQLGIDVLISQALADQQVLNALCGNGFDETVLSRALELADPDADVPIPFRASSAAAQLLSWAGRLDEAYEHIDTLWRRCIDTGADSDMLFIAVWSTLINVWRGDFVKGTETADAAMVCAEQMGGDHSLVIALTVRGLVAAYAGRVEQARADARAAIEAAERSEAPLLADWPMTTLGFLAVSLGDPEQALKDLQPLISGFDQLVCTEIIKAGFVPDAVEAMVSVGRQRDAEPMIDALERNGARLDRPWMLAIGARCRAMVLAAEGDIEAAEQVVLGAMEHHDRLAMPFERARTQLLLGQLQRRRRQKLGAARTLEDVLHGFEALGAPLWAERARAELARTNVGANRTVDLTPSERRVAELASSGMTNRDIAAKLFISVKTVEANLTQIYRKLGILSRAALGQLVDPPP
ncbi:helix-turn-helix transcriptional regulator [Mycolicibacterium pulveris]|uniref:helix-turn-helix transcriptional regulator n=1 Tax=Mycolicibacterium pulveris TaxID=36813 RepID=UPI003CEC0AED